MSHDLPPDMTLIARLIDAQPLEVQELFRFALVMSMVRDGRAEIIEQYSSDREYIAVRTNSGKLFSLAKPNVSEDQLKRVDQIVREVLDTDKHGTENGESSNFAQRFGAKRE